MRTVDIWFGGKQIQHPACGRYGYPHSSFDPFALFFGRKQLHNQLKLLPNNVSEIFRKYRFLELIMLKTLFFAFPSWVNFRRFFGELLFVFSRSGFLFDLAWKSSLLRSFLWSGKYHPTSELGKRSKTVLKTAIPTFLHGFLFLAQWTWTLCQLWLFETSFGPFSELRGRLELSGPGKWPHGRALSR